MQALLPLQSLSILNTMPWWVPRMLATGSVQHWGRCLELRHEESMYIWCKNFADYATIYSSINRLLSSPPPRDPRPRDGHSSRHPVSSSDASWSLPLTPSITRQCKTQSSTQSYNSRPWTAKTVGPGGVRGKFNPLTGSKQSRRP